MTLAQIDLHNPEKNSEETLQQNVDADSGSVDDSERLAGSLFEPNGTIDNPTSTGSFSETVLSKLQSPIFSLNSRLGAVAFGVVAILLAHLVGLHNKPASSSTATYRYLFEASALVVFFVCGATLMRQALRMFARGLWESPLIFFAVAATLILTRSFVLVLFDPTTFHSLSLLESTPFFLTCLFLLAFTEEFRLMILVRLQNTDEEILPETVTAFLEAHEAPQKLQRVDLIPGVRVVVVEGDVIPATGIVVSGEAVVGRQSNLFSGAHSPVREGHLVCIGHVIYSGRIEYIVSDHDDFSPQSYLESVLREARGSKVNASGFSLFLGRAVAGIVAFATMVSLSRLFYGEISESVSTVLVQSTGLCLITFIQSAVLTSSLVKRAAIVSFFRLGVLVANPSVLGRLPRIKNIVFDFSIPPERGVRSLRSFEILDDRFKASSVLSLLCVLLPRCTQSFFGRAALSLATRVDTREAPRVDTFHAFGERGFQATVEGANILFGTEDLLIEAEVPLQLSDVGFREATAEDELFFLVVNGDIVARLTFGGTGFLTGQDLVARLQKSRLRPHLMSSEPTEVVDQFSRTLGFELAQVKGGLTSTEYVERLQDMPDVAFIAHGSHKGHKAADVTISLFDRLQWNASETDISLLCRQIRLVPALFRWSRCLSYFEIASYLASALVAVTVCIAFYTGVATTAGVLATSLCFSLVLSVSLCLLFYRIRPERNPFSLVLESSEVDAEDKLSAATQAAYAS